MKLPRLALVFSACALVLAGCGGDDPTPTASNTTVPVVTQPPNTSGDAGTTTAPQQTDTTTTAPDPRAVNGDLTQVAVAAEVVGSYGEPVDTVVAPNGELWLAERRGVVSVLDPVTGEIGDTIIDISAETVAAGERGRIA